MTARAWFDAAHFERLRAEAGCTWGRPVRVLDRADSTNDLALAAVPTDARTGVVWVAREQTRGRGRRGNAWVAKPGEALLMSTLLRWPAPAETTTGIGLAVGLAILRACQPRVPEHRLGLKWPNDVVCEGAKLSGILIESRPDGRGGVGLVVGIGINVHARQFEPAAGRPTSLALLGAESAACAFEALLLDVLLELARVTAQVLSGQLAQVIADVRAFDALIGRRVCIVNREGASTNGLVRGLSDSGELELDTPSGVACIASGHVELE